MNSRVRLKVVGKNINRFVMRLIQNDIDIIELENISTREINVVVKKDDYHKVRKIKSIYQMKVIKYEGIVALKESINKNKLLIIIVLLGLSFLFLLSNIIFSVKVIHTDKNIRSLILEELSRNGIEVHKFKKSSKKISEIKEKILKKYKDQIEWLEIENYGTSYIIRVEERLIPDEEEVIPPRDVVAKKSAVILKIESTKGVIQKLVGNYVKTGDVIVSGTVKLNEEIKNMLAADATIYGEVWYTVKVEYPYIYSEKHYTGKSKNGIFFNFINFKYKIFGNKYSNSKIVDKIKLSTTFLPIYLSFSEEQEVISTDNIYTEEEALVMATKRSRKEMESKLKDGEYIIDEQKLKVEYEDNKIIVEMFYSVCENITEYRNIEIIQ